MLKQKFNEKLVSDISRKRENTIIGGLVALYINLNITITVIYL
jgi:hypothetical protein